MTDSKSGVQKNTRWTYNILSPEIESSWVGDAASAAPSSVVGLGKFKELYIHSVGTFLYLCYTASKVCTYTLSRKMLNVLV